MSTGKNVGAIFGALSVGAVALASGAVVRRYRRDMRAARDRLAAVDRKVIKTALGDIEYAESGTGEPLLVSHGIFGSCESALLFQDLFAGRRIIAASRTSAGPPAP
jgi:hypothetical protein